MSGEPGCSSDACGLRLWEAVAAQLSGDDTGRFATVLEGIPSSLRAAAIGWRNPRDKGRTPLHLAAIGGADDILRALLREAQPGQVDARDDDLETPLHYAACFSNSFVLSTLIEYGADVQAKDRNGASPLHMAALWNRSRNANLLLSHQAVIDSRDVVGQTPLHWAVTGVISGFETVVGLLDHGADIESRTQDGRTALHLAALKDRHLKSLEVLIDSGGDIEGRDDDGHTALHWTARFNARRNLVLLLSKGADRASKDRDGKTAYDLARNDDMKRLLREFTTTDSYSTQR